MSNVVLHSQVSPNHGLYTNRVKDFAYVDRILYRIQPCNCLEVPNIFIEAAKQLNMSPHECVVLEDAQSGVMAGKAARMKVIAVPNKYTKYADFSAADLVVSSLNCITLDRLKKVLNGAMEVI